MEGKLFGSQVCFSASVDIFTVSTQFPNLHKTSPYAYGGVNCIVELYRYLNYHAQALQDFHSGEMPLIDLFCHLNRPIWASQDLHLSQN